MTKLQTSGLADSTRDELLAAGLDPDDIVTVVRRAVDEDLGAVGDVTSAATVPADQRMVARYVARDRGVAAGIPVLRAVVEICGHGEFAVDARVADGERLDVGTVLAEVSGNARSILAIERLSLNLLGHLCGIATGTRAWVDAVHGTSAKIRDTRKTTPGLRDLEKYAVRCGGGVNHRRGLDGGVLIKDNHVEAAGGVGAALDAVTAAYPSEVFVVQVEVDTLAQLDEALEHGAQQVLLDNFTEAEMAAAVERVRATSPEVMIEASGRLSLDRASAVAETGIDFLAIGALTHSSPVLDIGLDAVS